MSTKDIDQPTTSTVNEYRYNRFTTSLLFRDLRFRKGAAAMVAALLYTMGLMQNAST